MPEPTDTPKVAKVRNLVAFTAGLRNGENYGPGDIRELVDNFHRFQSVDPGTGRPYWLPYASINHEEGKYDGLSVGDVVDARVGTSDDGTPALILDLDRVPPDVKTNLDSGRLRAVSVEFFDPDSPFVGPDGKPVDGPVLKSVSFLGAMSESSKGMPAPVATFADRVKVRRFSSESAMDRQQIIAALQAAGVDTTLVTDAVPDELLQSMMKAVQSSQKGDDGTNSMGDQDDQDDKDDVQSFKDRLRKFLDIDDDPNNPDGQDKKFAVGDESGNQAGQRAAMNHYDPPTHDEDGDVLGWVRGKNRKNSDDDSNDDITKKFADLRRQARAIDSQNQRIMRFQAEQILNAKKAKIKRFCDDLSASGQLQPATRPAMESLLLKCDDVTIRKFSDKKKTGTDLDEQMARLKATLPKVRTFGDKVPDPAGGPVSDVRQEVIDRMRSRIKSSQNVAAKK